jgi:hypothetical protein
MKSRQNPMRAGGAPDFKLRLSPALLFCILYSAMTTLSAQTLPPRLRETLVAGLKASDEALRTLEGGGVAAYAIDTGSPSRIKLVGVIRIWATPEAFVKNYRNIDAFESVPGVSVSRKLHVPPMVGDLDGIVLSAAETAELKACKPGNCAFKMDDDGLKQVRETVKWGAPDEAAEVSAAIRRLWLEKLKTYMAKGNAGLPVYHDSPDYSSVEESLNELLADSGALHEYAPQLNEYLLKYPRSRNRRTENFFYWQSGDFGLKTVHRVSHVAIQRTAAKHGDAFVIASKMLFANHYFRSGLEFRYLIPGQDQKAGGMLYLVLVQSSEVDGMDGWQGRLLRPIVVSKSLTAMEKYLGAVKEKTEREFASGGKE